MQDDQYLTVQDVAEQVGMHPDTVRRLLREGRIKGHRINRRAGWRIKRSEVVRFLEGDEGEENEDRRPE